MSARQDRTGERKVASAFQSEMQRLDQAWKSQAKIQNVQARNRTEDWNMKGASTVDLKRANQKTLGIIHMRWLTVVSTVFLNEPAALQ